MEDKDANCRLKYGLNVHCLAYIFQYVDSEDLYTLGEMNNFYKQIIKDFVISKHEINFDKLYQKGIKIQQVFESYGTNIRHFRFSGLGGKNATERLIQSIIQYCSADQLKCVKFSRNRRPYQNVHLPIQFRSIEHLELNGYILQTTVVLPETIRYLNLRNIQDLSWTTLKNLKELYLINVDGINAQDFIEFLATRPSIEVFHHDRDTFSEYTSKICEALAKYCGDGIREYSGAMPFLEEDDTTPKFYNFVSGFKNVKKMCLRTHRICGGDLIDAMKRLAENDTIETLQIKFQKNVWRRNIETNDIFVEGPNLNMKHFSHLKKIMIFGYGFKRDRIRLNCPLKLLRVFGSQILTNIEQLTIGYPTCNWDFINFMLKLRHLHLNVSEFGREKAAKLIPILVSNLQDRNNEQIRSNSIEIKLNEKYIRDIIEKEICEINNRTNDEIFYKLNGDYMLTIYHMNEVCLTTRYICGGDLIDEIKRLADNDTIKMLCINYFNGDWLNMPNVNCIFQERPDLDGLDMKHFTNLRTIKISGYCNELNIYRHGHKCHPFKLINVYGSQILSHVKQLIIDGPICDWNMIKLSPELRHLDLNISSDEAVKIAPILSSILQERKIKQISSNSIEILDIFAKEISEKNGDFFETLIEDHNLTIFPVKENCLTAHQLCGGDLIDRINILAENDTIEMLSINYSNRDSVNTTNVKCVFQEKPELEDFIMNHFCNLKTIKISGSFTELDNYSHGHECHPFKLLSVFGSQILSNVEELTINCPEHNWDIIKFAVQLRFLNLTIKDEFDYNQAAKLISILVTNLQFRNNQQQTRGDFIEIKCETKDVLEMFTTRILDLNKMNINDTILYATSGNYVLTIYHNF